jgi:hypothetical protein
MTYEQTQQKLGAPTRVTTGNAVRGPITWAVWDSPDKATGFGARYDTPSGLPYSLYLYLAVDSLSNEQELRKAANLQQDDPRLEVSMS